MAFVAALQIIANRHLPLSGALAAMDALDTRRLGYAAQTLAKGKAALADNPDQGLYWVKSALRLRATTLTKLASPEAEASIRELVAESVRLHKKLEAPLPLTERNDLVVLALALRETALAQDALAIPAKADGYPFTVALSDELESALAPATPPQATTSASLEVAERALIEGFSRREVVGAERFWSLTRRKRFANTIHEHRNFYAEAVAALAGS